MFIWLGISYYFAHTKLDYILKSMEKAGGRVRSRSHYGLRGRSHLIAEISSILLFPKTHIQAGLATEAEIYAIPKNLRIQMNILSWTSFFIFAGLTLTVLAIKLFDL